MAAGPELPQTEAGWKKFFLGKSNPELVAARNEAETSCEYVRDRWLCRVAKGARIELQRRHVDAY